MWRMDIEVQADFKVFKSLPNVGSEHTGLVAEWHSFVCSVKKLRDGITEDQE